MISKRVYRLLMLLNFGLIIIFAVRGNSQIVSGLNVIPIILLGLRFRFWQIRLTTAIIIMFVASVLVGVNVMGRQTFNDIYEFGWPLTFYIDSRTASDKTFIEFLPNRQLNVFRCLLDLYSCLFVIVAVGIVSEKISKGVDGKQP